MTEEPFKVIGQRAACDPLPSKRHAPGREAESQIKEEAPLGASSIPLPNPDKRGAQRTTSIQRLRFVIVPLLNARTEPSHMRA